jgi:hypothetical protein
MRRDVNTDLFYRRYLALIAVGRAKRAARERQERGREGVATVMLTTLAASLGAFALAVMVAGFAGHPAARWSEPHPVIARPMNPNGMYWYRLPTGDEDMRLSLARVVSLYLPSRECVGLWMLGFLFTLPAALRRGATRSVMLSLALLLPSVVIMAVVFTLLAIGWFPSFTW